MRRLTAFDFHNKTNRIYWADKYTKSIYSAYENGTDLIKIIGSGLNLVESIAIDWIGENIYWADYLMQHIEVSKLTGKNRKILFNINITNPRAIVLDPRSKFRYIFWTDWGKWPRIERANMDGFNRTAIVTTKLYWPNGLAIDLNKQRLYFVDAHLDYIESCDYNGQRRTQVLANDLMIHHPHGLSFFENNLYWVDRGHKSLIKMNRFDSKNKSVISELSYQALIVKVVHGVLQPNEENPCTKSNCEQLCLLSHDSLSGYRCDCQIGYIKDMDNENRCNRDQSEFLLILNDNVIGGLKIFPNDTVQTDNFPTFSDSLFEDEVKNDEESGELFNVQRERGFMWDRLVPVNDIEDGYDFTYDYGEQYLYWLQHNKSSSAISIQRVKFDGEKRETLISINNVELLSQAYCLDFDASSRNLFIGNIIDSQIEAINVDNMQRTVIFSEKKNEFGIGRPIMITINFLDSEIYWLDEGFELVPKKIGMVKTDGSQSRNIIDKDINSPVSLFYHYKSRKIFWADNGRKKIESISIDNLSDRTVIISDVESPTAITIWDISVKTFDNIETHSILYYSDLIQEQLIAFSLKTGEKRIIKSNVPKIIQLKVYQAPSFLPTINPCLTRNGDCHQICLASKNTNGRICRCSNGLELQNDNKSCKLYQNFILFATSQSIRAIPYSYLDKPIDNSLEALPIINGYKIGKFDFDYKSRSIIWVEDDRLVYILSLNFSWTSIYNSKLETNFVNKKVLFELNSSTGKLMSLAFDWISNQLYYSYNDQSINYIKVTNYPSISFHYTIFSSKSDKPSLIVINPKLRYLYWIDDSQYSKLERSYLNGAGRTVLIKNDMISPTDLVIDINNGDLYWSDNTKDTIEKCDWNGKNRKILKSSNIPNVRSLSILDNIIYYADSRLKSIFYLNLSSYVNNSKEIQSNKLKTINSLSLNEILIFTERSQPLNIDSPCYFTSVYNKCDQLCFSLPNETVAKCACINNYLLLNFKYFDY
jgi:low density lipoprotein-related protein 2